MRQRLDVYLVANDLVPTRSQAESVVRLGGVMVNGKVIKKPGHFVLPKDEVKIIAKQSYVSRAGLKLASVAELLALNFATKLVLDVGSSTGGFTDYALQHGARKVIAVDVGTQQLHPSLRNDKRIELHEKTDIRNVRLSDSLSLTIHSTATSAGSGKKRALTTRRDIEQETVTISEIPDIVVIDVSFISLRDILPHVAMLTGNNTQIVAMLKPQFEAGRQQVQKGIIKNDSIRRQVVKDFELWSRQYFVLLDKRDSEVAGAKGNRERFYLLKPL